jgi:hypothetical protein
MTGRKGWGGENYREKWSLNDLNCLACFGSISNGALTLETQQQLIAMINGFPEREILADGIYKAVLRYSELLRLSTPMSHRITHHITGRRPYPLALLSCRIFALYSFFRLWTGSFCIFAVCCKYLFSSEHVSFFFCSPLRGTLACFIPPRFSLPVVGTLIRKHASQCQEPLAGCRCSLNCPQPPNAELLSINR